MNEYDPVQYIEQFHLLFLEQLGRKVDKALYALKGGCHLRFFLKSIRYSQAYQLTPIFTNHYVNEVVKSFDQ